MDQWNRIERLEIHPHKRSQLTFGKGTKTTQRRPGSLPTNGAKQVDIYMPKKESQHSPLILCKILTQNRSDSKCKIIKILEGNTGENLDGPEHGDDSR